MLDIKALRENTAEMKQALSKKKVSPETIDKVLEMDEQKRQLQRQMEAMRAELNSLSKEITMSDEKKRSKLLEKSKSIKEKLKFLEPTLDKIENGFNELIFNIPNFPDKSVPEGNDENDNVEISRWGEIPKIKSPLDHVDIGTKLGILDIERAAKMSGTRFSILKGNGAKLERALMAFMLDMQTKAGYTEIIPPYLVNPESMFATGQLPKFEEDLFQTKIGERKLYMIPTAEVPIINLYRDEILEEKDLPIRMCALTPCFRSEAGSYGKDTRGILRQHQFHKVELISFCKPQQAETEFKKLTKDAEAILQKLELPYRTISLCGGDLGFGAQKTYDLEVWIPSQNKYREIVSSSTCGDFQARRGAIRYRDKENNEVKLINTLNCSGIPTGRTWLAIIENYQQEDGSVKVPKALQPYMNGLEKITSV